MSRRRAVVLAVAGILMIQASWMIALPAFRGPDEIEHMKRASSYALGDFRPSPNDSAAKGELVTVERDVADALHDRCAELHADFDPESCLPVGAGTGDTVQMASITARYNPAWYLLVAPASWFLEGDGTLWMARSLNALASAGLLLWAWSRWRIASNTLLARAAFLLCLTPAVGFASVVAAPNGLHYAAGLLLWTALLSSSAERGASDPLRGRAVAIAGSVLVLTHTLGNLWIPAAIVVYWLLRGWPGIRGLLGDLRSAPWSTTVFVASQSFAISWIVLSGTNDPSGGDPLSDITKQMPALGHAVVWLFQLIGTMPYRFGLLWMVVYALWLAAFAVLLGSSLRHIQPRASLALGAAVLGAIVVPAAATIATYDGLGYAWQGRYELPLVFCIPLIAGLTASPRGTPTWAPMTAITLGATGCVVAVACLAWREGQPGTGITVAVVTAALGWAALTRSTYEAQSS